MVIFQDTFGLFIRDQLHQMQAVGYFIERDDDLLELRFANKYFEEYEDWSVEEQKIIDLSKGKVLDIGCGAGRHSLYLQNKGLDVYGLDISEIILEVLRERGLRKVMHGSIHNLDSLNMKFDTILFMGNNLPLAGSYNDMIKVLKVCHGIISDDGNIILHFINPLPTNDPIHLALHRSNKVNGKRIGRYKIRIRYKNFKTEFFEFYIPTEEEFIKVIEISGWKINNNYKQKHNNFVELIKK